jgi:dihydrofolate reductase
VGAEASVAEEAAAALDATEKDVAIGGAGLAAAAIELGLVDELRISAIRSSSVAARRFCRRSPKTYRWS